MPRYVDRGHDALTGFRDDLAAENPDADTDAFDTLMTALEGEESAIVDGESVLLHDDVTYDPETGMLTVRLDGRKAVVDAFSAETRIEAVDGDGVLLEDAVGNRMEILPEAE